MDEWRPRLTLDDAVVRYVRAERLTRRVKTKSSRIERDQAFSELYKHATLLDRVSAERAHIESREYDPL